MLEYSMKLQNKLTMGQKLLRVNWFLIVLIGLTSCVGFVALYSAGGGNIDKWAAPQMQRFMLGFVVMLFITLIDVKWWHRLSYFAYFAGFALLIIVEVKGHVGMGAQRWIDLGFMKLQPSELMKIAVIMAIAKYYNNMPLQDVRRTWMMLPPLAMIFAPVSLVLLQPDLGTSLMIVMAGAGMMFLAGVKMRWFVGAITAGVAAIPVAWEFMHEYQKERVRTFLDPERDPLGAGYHITQSKIALGSGGIEGKGFMQGTQSHLNFLPEKQTDFIFTLWAEEFGLLGGIGLLILLSFIFAYGLYISARCKHDYGKLLSMGLILNFSLYAFINIGMVMGLLPVVGAPLPLVSYGGTSMLATMAAFGLIMSCNVYRDTKLNRV